METNLNNDFRFRLDTQSPVHGIDFSYGHEWLFQEPAYDIESLGPHERHPAGYLQRLRPWYQFYKKFFAVTDSSIIHLGCPHWNVLLEAINKVTPDPSHLTLITQIADFLRANRDRIFPKPDTRQAIKRSRITIIVMCMVDGILDALGRLASVHGKKSGAFCKLIQCLISCVKIYLNCN